MIHWLRLSVFSHLLNLCSTHLESATCGMSSAGGSPVQIQIPNFFKYYQLTSLLIGDNRSLGSYEYLSSVTTIRILFFTLINEDWKLSHHSDWHCDCDCDSLKISSSKLTHWIEASDLLITAVCCPQLCMSSKWDKCLLSAIKCCS